MPKLPNLWNLPRQVGCRLANAGLPTASLLRPPTVTAAAMPAIAAAMPADSC